MKIFIIDDDLLSIFLTKNMLLLADPTFEIKTFLSGLEALEHLTSFETTTLPDLILLDLNMPVMDGWDFLHALSPIEQKLKDCSIYILTSSLDVADTVRTKDYPVVTGLIHKPIKQEDIEYIFSH